MMKKTKILLTRKLFKSCDLLHLFNRKKDGPNEKINCQEKTVNFLTSGNLDQFERRQDIQVTDFSLKKGVEQSS